MKKKTAASFLLALLTPVAAWAAACCGGGFALPSLLVGDDRAQMTTSLTAATTDIDVQPSGKWITRGNPERSETFRIESAGLISDLWQLGGSAPITRRARSGPDGEGSASGLGDIALTAGFEALPEWDYSAWRPKGIVFMQLMLPTGRSRLESADDLNLDVTGRGLYSVGPGVLLTKIKPPFDLQFLLEAHRSLPRDIDSPQAGGRVHLEPGNGATASLSGGCSRGDWRWGLGVVATYEDAIGVRPAAPGGSVGGIANDSSEIRLERYATVTASVAYLVAPEWAAAAAYADQTLLGSPTNTTLSRSLIVSLQRHWQR